MQNDDNWPKRPDGTNKTMGEMSREEQREQWRKSAQRVGREFSDRVTVEHIPGKADHFRIVTKH